MPRKAPHLCQRKDGRYYVTDPASHRPIYFGRDAAESEKLYGRWLMEFYARGPGVPYAPPFGGVTVDTLIDAYLRHADTYYRKNGKVTSEVNTVEQITRVVCKLYGSARTSEFGPSAFKAVREHLVQSGYARKHINKQMGRVRRIWKWGVEQEIVRPDVLAAIEAVAPLAKGRTPARETAPIRAVPWPTVEATLPFLRYEYLRVMVQVHYLAACRAGDVVRMRPVDIDRSTEVWVFCPYTHKTEHLDKPHLIYLGPQCQKLLAPVLRMTTPKGWLFPSVGCGRHRGRGPGHLTVNGYRQVVESAVKKANRERAKTHQAPLPHWFPLQIRHAALTQIRKRFGIEGAQVMGDHSEMKTTEIYAEKNQELAYRIAAAVG